MAHARLRGVCHEKRTVKRLIWSFLLLLPCGVIADEVYRSVDENGQVVYSDRPDMQTVAELIVVENNPSNPVPGTNAAGRPADSENESEEEPTLLIPREGTPEEIAADRTRNCDYARQMQEAYSQAHRLFREGPDGEREYLSDDELTEARTKAESDVATWCD